MSTPIKCSRCKNTKIYAAYKPLDGFTEWQYKIEKEQAQDERKCSEYQIDWRNRLWQKFGKNFEQISSDDEGVNEYIFFCKCGHSGIYRYF